MAVTAAVLNSEERPAKPQLVREQGVLVVENVVSDAELAPVIAEYEAWVAEHKPKKAQTQNQQ